MSTREKVARFVTRLTRLTNEDVLMWQSINPTEIYDQLHLIGDGKVTSSIYEASVEGLSVRLYSCRRKLGLSERTTRDAWGQPANIWKTEYVIEFVNSEGYSAAEYSGLPGLATLFDLVRRKAFSIDEKLTAFMEKDNNHAERHHG